MGFYDTLENVQAYIDMAEGYDGKELIDILRDHLNPDATVLELGMGPGKDLDFLKNDFKVTGSDNSQVFIDLYREKYPKADLLLLNAESIKTERTFDCIYSNKVLHHLTKDELARSFKRQSECLNPGGIVFHTFWKGDKEELLNGMLFVYYNGEAIKAMIDGIFSVMEITTYTEMEDDDSIYVILKKIG